MLKYTDITQNTYVQSWTVTEIMAREKCGLLAGPHTVPVTWQSYPFPSLSVVSYDGNSAHASHRAALRDRIFAAAEHIRNHRNNITSATQSLLTRAENCFAAGGGHFEQLL